MVPRTHAKTPTANNAKPAKPNVAGSGTGVKLAEYGWLCVGAAPISVPPWVGSPLHHCALKVNVPELTNPDGALLLQRIWYSPAAVTGL